MPISIDNLKEQRRWIVWRLTKRADGSATKEPFSPKGYKASIKDPANWYTYAEVEPIAHNFSGIGLVLGDLGGSCDYVWGVDLDKCCDAVTGKFSPETKALVIRLDSFTQFSPSGTGCHVWGTGGRVPLNTRGEVIVRPYPGAKQIEVKGDGYYFTWNDNRHISKTPQGLMERGEQLAALVQELNATPVPSKGGLLVSGVVSLSEDERYKKLMAGDMSDYNDDHSRSDFALCIILAKKHDCNAFKIDDAFRESGLYREKWERDDYREGTITAAIKAVAKETAASILVSEDPADALNEDGETEFLLNAHDPTKDGVFPKGEVNAIGGPSGVGKTSLAVMMLEQLRAGREVWGHSVPKARDFRVLMHDRSKKAFRRTAKSLNLSEDAQSRVIRLSPAQQKASPAEVLEASIHENPGAEVWLLEGLDLWMPDANKMSVVSDIMDGLQRVATRRDVCIIATVGSPKQKGKDRYFGRDALFGSSALARKLETIVIIGLSDETDPNSTREVWVHPRTSRAEKHYFKFGDSGLEETEEPEKPDSNNAVSAIEQAVRARFAPGDEVKYEECLGASTTFYRWRDKAVKNRFIRKTGEKFILMPVGVKNVD